MQLPNSVIESRTRTAAGCRSYIAGDMYDARRNFLEARAHLPALSILQEGDLSHSGREAYSGLLGALSMAITDIEPDPHAALEWLEECAAEAIALNCWSEAAMLVFQKSLLFIRLRDREGAAQEYRREAKFWKEAGMPQAAASAAWKVRELEGTIPRRALRILEGLCNTARMEALRLLDLEVERLWSSGRAGHVRGNREKVWDSISVKRIQEIADQAVKLDAINNPL